MKIAYIIPNKNEKGGIQQFAKSNSAILGERHSIHSIDNIFGYYLSDLIEPIFCKVPGLIRAVIFSLVIVHIIRHRYKLHIFDLIHFWHLDTAVAFTNSNYIVTCHGMEILSHNLTSYKKIMYKKVLNNAKSITADSTYTKDLITQNFAIDSSKITVINPGVNIKEFDKPRKKNKRLIIGSISRFVPRKNFLNIIKALEILSRTMDFEYYIAGDGDQRDEILNALKNVSFKWKYFGMISDEEKASEFYPLLDIFVLPTLELKDSIEGFGIVYLEANSAGIPVVASAVGGVVDAVKEEYSGIFCNPTDPKDIAEKTKKIINNIDKYKLNTKKWVQQFDDKNIAKKFETLYLKD